MLDAADVDAYDVRGKAVDGRQRGRQDRRAARPPPAPAAFPGLVARGRPRSCSPTPRSNCASRWSFGSRPRITRTASAR